MAYSSQRIDIEDSAPVIDHGVRQLQGPKQISAESYLDYTRLISKIWHGEKGTGKMAVVTERCYCLLVVACELIVSLLITESNRHVMITGDPQQILVHSKRSATLAKCRMPSEGGNRRWHI